MLRTNRTPFTDLCVLIGERKIYDTGRHYTTEESRTELLCSVTKGVSRSEYYEAYKAGVQLAITVEIYEDDYEGQRLLEIGANRYRIERTFPTGYGTIELSCSEVIR